MTIKEMHYDFKKKLNKIDSQQYKNLLVPEIDWVLNEAQNVFVDMVSQPRLNNQLGFEKSQKNVDDIRTLVVRNYCSNVLQNLPIDSEKEILSTQIPFKIPADYRYYVKSEAYLNKKNCKDKKARIHIREHDDEFELSPFDKSSFEWREVNATFSEKDIVLYTDGTFTISKFCLTYLRNPVLIHNAEDFRSGEYKLPSGVTLTGHVDCELPSHTHREIVDIAVLITTGELQIPDYQIKMNKLNLNNLK